MKDSEPSSYLAFFGLGLTWSVVMPLGRVAGEAGVPPMIFPFAQALGAFVVLTGIILFLRNRLPRPVPWALFMVSGLAGHAIPQIISYISVQKLPLAIVGLIIATNPIQTGVLAAVTGTQIMSRRRIIGVIIGFLGVIIVSTPGAVLPGLEALPWILFGLLTPACFAIANTYSARLRPANSNSLRDAVGMMGVSSAALFVAALLFGQSFDFAANGIREGEMALIVHGVLAGLAFFLFFVVLDRGGPIMVACASYLILLLSGIWGWLFFDEVPSPAFFLAACFVIAGLTLVITSSEDQRRSDS